MSILRALLALVFLCSGVAVVEAQTRCVSRESMLKALTGKYQERRMAAGVSDYGIAELYVSAKGTWTMIITTSPRMSCILHAGKNWRAVKDQPVPGEDS